MILAVDTSALLHRHTGGPHHGLVIETLSAATSVVVSELARTELLMCVHRMASDAGQADRASRAIRGDWDQWTTVPVDDRCLATAADIGTRFRVRVPDAIHLAAADRLPRPTHFLSLDPQQLPAAAALGFEVVAPLQR